MLSNELFCPIFYKVIWVIYTCLLLCDWLEQVGYNGIYMYIR
jgi:hypothetical protein